MAKSCVKISELFTNKKIIYILIMSFFLIIIFLIICYNLKIGKEKILLYINDISANDDCILGISPHKEKITFRIKTSLKAPTSGNALISFNRKEGRVYISAISDTFTEIDLQNKKAREIKLKDGYCAAISSTGRFMAYYDSPYVIIEDLKTNKKIFSFQSSHKAVPAICWTVYGDKLVSLNEVDYELMVYDANKRKIVYKRSRISVGADQISISPDEKKIAYSYRDLTYKPKPMIGILSLDGKYNKIIRRTDQPYVMGPTWSPDGNKIYYSISQDIFEYDIGSGKERFIRKGIMPILLPISKDLLYYIL